MADYPDLPLYSPSDRRELELREIDKYDSMNPELFYDYVDRLEHAKSFLDTHLQAQFHPKAQELKRTLLDYSGLAGGMTNFWQNPYEFSGFDTNQANQFKLHRDFSDNTAFAYMYPTRPYDLHLSAENIDKEQYPSSRLLGHEMTHVKESLDSLNQVKGYNSSGWRPNFSNDMYNDLLRLAYKKGAYYKGKGLGTDPGETISYLRGREGELRKGKTLMDDPDTAEVFKKYPGSYEEYLRSSKVLKSHKGKK